MHTLKPHERSSFLLVLRRLAEHHELLPDRMVISEKIEVSDEVLVAGGYGDIRSGTYMDGLVAVKTARVAAQDNLQQIRKVGINGIFESTWGALSTILLQRFYREVILWETLSHPNVLKLVGVQEDMEKRQFATVSEWMAHGNIMEYIKKSYTNRLELVRDSGFLATFSAKIR